MSEVTRNVIMDLLPLYLAGEVSEDTSALVKRYIDANPEMGEIVSQMTKMESLNEVPAPFSKEIAMETFKEAKKWTVIRTLGLAAILALVLICLFTAMVVISFFVNFRHTF